MADPSARVRREVYARDQHCCVRCGRGDQLTLQHRKGRGMGGSSDPAINDHANLLTLCGSGTTGCHGWVESHPTEAALYGWRVARWQDPTEVPVATFRGWVQLHAGCAAYTPVADPLAVPF